MKPPKFWWFFYKIIIIFLFLYVVFLSASGDFWNLAAEMFWHLGDSGGLVKFTRLIAILISFPAILNVILMSSCNYVGFNKRILLIKSKGRQTCRPRNSSNTWLARCLCYPSQAVQYNSSSSALLNIDLP